MSKLLEDLHLEWAKDCTIDESDAGVESLKIPQLHSKYLNLLSKERLRAKALIETKNQLANVLEDYYEGRIDGPSIGREPWQYVKGTKTKTEKLILADKEMVQLNIKIAATEERVLFLKEVLVNINQRNFQIKNYLEWLKFTGGQTLR